MKIVFLTEKYGDLGNRLFRFARLYTSKPRGITLLDISFCQYSHLYEPRRWRERIGFKLLTLLRRPLLESIGPRIRTVNSVYKVRRIGTAGLATDYPTCEEVYHEIQQQKSLLCHLEGTAFHYRCSTQAVPEHRDRLRDIFVLKGKYRRRAADLLRQRIADSFLVAVHIRRNDYRVFDGGKRCYDDEVYLRSMLRLRETHAEPRPLQFLVLGDEDIEVGKFSPLTPLYFGRQDVGTDQALLEASDAIIGAPSTFSAWPSFLHHIPRAIISSSAHTVSWADFNPAEINMI